MKWLILLGAAFELSDWWIDPDGFSNNEVFLLCAAFHIIVMLEKEPKK